MNPNIFPKIIKNNKNKKETKESGCCFRSCGGKPGFQEDKRNINNFVGKILKKIR